MTHSGKWVGRTKMAWRAFYLGAILLIAGIIAVFMDKDGPALLLAGSGLISMVFGIDVGGKVIHDRDAKSKEPEK